jgi:hypothetical protein
MSVTIQPNKPRNYSEEEMQALKQMGQFGVELREEVIEKQASKEKPMEKKASVTKEQQAQYWRDYFENAGVFADFEDWYNILFGE